MQDSPECSSLLDSFFSTEYLLPSTQTPTSLSHLETLVPLQTPPPSPIMKGILRKEVEECQRMTSLQPSTICPTLFDLSFTWELLVKCAYHTLSIRSWSIVCFVTAAIVDPKSFRFFNWSCCELFNCLTRGITQFWLTDGAPQARWERHKSSWNRRLVQSTCSWAGHFIDGLLNAGYIESAKGLVRKMTKEDFVPYVATFNSLAEVVFKSREVDFVVIF